METIKINLELLDEQIAVVDEQSYLLRGRSLQNGQDEKLKGKLEANASLLDGLATMLSKIFVLIDSGEAITIVEDK
jgi:hypothetical protein